MSKKSFLAELSKYYEDGKKIGIEWKHLTNKKTRDEAIKLIEEYRSNNKKEQTIDKSNKKEQTIYQNNEKTPTERKQQMNDYKKEIRKALKKEHHEQRIAIKNRLTEKLLDGINIADLEKLLEYKRKTQHEREKKMMSSEFPLVK